MNDKKGSNADHDLIGTASSVQEVIDALAVRGCSDLTSKIDLDTCGDFPLAGGGFCDVYRGKMKYGDGIAIKSLRLYDRPGKDNEKDKILKRAARELYHWSKLNHPNVLQLMGLAMFRGHLAMISEWMDNGSLTSYISLNPDVDRIGLCLDVCSGLAHIHAHDMIHGDLKAANVMVGRNGTAMIADFGNSQLKDLTLKFTNTTSSSLSVRWAAPELLDGDEDPQASKASDVYAYGMTVLETLTGKVPYEEFGERKVLILVAFKHEPPTRPETGFSDGMWTILQNCWTWKKSERPDIASIEERLRDVYLRSWVESRPDNSHTDLPSASKSLAVESRSNSISVPDTLPVYYTRKLESMVALAETYREQGRLAEAQLLGGEALGVLKRVLGADHPTILQGMINLASICREQGRFAEAASLRSEVLATSRRILGADHPDTLASIETLAIAYHEQGRPAEAESLEVEALIGRKRALGEDHPDTLATMANLALMYHQQDQLAEAEALGVDVLAANKRVLGTDHPDTLASMVNLANTYSQQGRLEEAELLEVEALAAQKRVLGLDHPNTLLAMANLAVTYHKQGALEEAESLEVEVLAGRRRILGLDHPNTLLSMANLANTYHERGRLAEVESLDVEALAARKRVLGADHPDTLASMNNLAATYLSQGRLADAESLGIEVLDARKRVLGEDHPDTLQSMYDLARTYKAQGHHATHKSLMAQLDEILAR